MKRNYEAKILWNRKLPPGRNSGYSREHEWSFADSLSIPASASPLHVPVPLSNPEAVDPEEALGASASSCHMLWYLALAEEAGFPVLSYQDQVTAEFRFTEDGLGELERILLHPQITYLNASPTAATTAQLH